MEPGIPPGGVGGTPAGPAAGFAPSPDVAVSPTATDVLDEELPGFEDDGTRITDRPTLTRAWAIGVPAAFVAVLVYMLVGRFTDLVPWEDGAGASLVGGTAIILMALVTVTSRRSDALEFCATHFIDGLSYAFKAMGIILPVAGFVYIGIPDYSGAILGLDDDTTGPAFLFDTVERVQPYIPDNGVFVALSMLFIGMAVGLDGSGWAGLPLTGGLAAALAPQSGMDTATLAAIAQNGATWTGGGNSRDLVVAGGGRRILPDTGCRTGPPSRRPGDGRTAAGYRSRRRHLVAAQRRTRFPHNPDREGHHEMSSVPFRYDPARCALIVIDMQKDFCSPDGSLAQKAST